MRDFELLTYREFEWYWVGYQRREKEKWRHTREILAFISNSRMGTKKAITGKELFPFEDEKQQLNDQSFEELLRLTKAK